ncbi:MAG TPA: choline-sulfatase [Bryobacteraceae bacterium]|nr:choline-sulfatase [Bryobacteraceae bacterium]
MTRRDFARLPAFGAAPALPSPAQAQRRAAAGGPPNIIFFMADQMTPFMTGPYGQKLAHTPHLDALAGAGVVFENAYCNSPLCVPSRLSMFTGRLPQQVGAYDNASEFAAHHPTLLHYLRRAGYRTAVSGKTHFIGPDQLHGFDERLSPCIFPADFAMLPDWSLGPVYNKGTSMQSMLRALGPSVWNRQLAFDQMTFDRSIERLRQHALARDAQPLFLNVSLTQPHDPFTTTREFLDIYKDAELPLPRDHGDIRRLSPTYEWFVIHHGTDREKLSPEKIREARRNYLGMISWVDDKVGRLMGELRRLGLADNTIVVFTSDHGEMLGEHGQWSKRLMLEWSARIPLIMAGTSRIAAGRRVAAPVSLLDLFPTFAEIAGAKIETPLDGHSLMPLVSGAADGRDREVIAEYMGEGPIEPIRMLRSRAMKYIMVNGYGPQLYDLSRDPEESVNLAGNSGYSAVESQLRKRIETGWDGPALKKAVLASQRERAVVRSIAQHGTAPSWASRFQSN